MGKLEEPATGEFSVYQFFPDGFYERVLAFVSDAEAVHGAAKLCRSVGAKIGTTQRVIITDGGDYTVFEWRFGLGITFPLQDGETRQ
jgi:hypothetical protein